MTNTNFNDEGAFRTDVSLERERIAREDAIDALATLLTGIPDETYRREVAELIVGRLDLMTKERIANHLRALKSASENRSAAND